MKNSTQKEKTRTKIQSMPLGETRAQQNTKDQTDVNKIIAKYKKTGILDHLSNKTGVYADITEVGDYEKSMQTIVAAKNAFMALPSQIRNRFGNDPHTMIQFLTDSKNDAEAIKLGLKVPREIQKDPILDELKTINQNTKPKNEQSPSK